MLFFSFAPLPLFIIYSEVEQLGALICFLYQLMMKLSQWTYCDFIWDLILNVCFKERQIFSFSLSSHEYLRTDLSYYIWLSEAITTVVEPMPHQSKHRKGKSYHVQVFFVAKIVCTQVNFEFIKVFWWKFVQTDVWNVKFFVWDSRN